MHWKVVYLIKKCILKCTEHIPGGIYDTVCVCACVYTHNSCRENSPSNSPFEISVILFPYNTLKKKKHFTVRVLTHVQFYTINVLMLKLTIYSSGRQTFSHIEYLLLPQCFFSNRRNVSKVFVNKGKDIIAAPQSMYT